MYKRQNLSGMLKVRVSREFGQSTVARILDLVENSTARKSRSEHFITRFARYYTPAVVFAALAPVSYTHLDVYKRQIQDTGSQHLRAQDPSQ